LWVALECSVKLNSSVLLSYLFQVSILSGYSILQYYPKMVFWAHAALMARVDKRGRGARELGKGEGRGPGGGVKRTSKSQRGLRCM
jgi:hypothetical protein